MTKMDIFRLLAAALAFSVCALWGFCRKTELHNRVVFLGEISSLLERFAVGIKCFKRTSDELLENENGEFARLVRSYLNEQTDIREAWEAACGELPKKHEETALLQELGRSLGSSDTESTLRLLERCAERISQLKSAAEAESEKRGKAVFHVGALCGIGAAILII